MYSIGIDLGGTNIAVGMVAGDGRIVYQQSVPTRRERPAREIIKDMVGLTTRVIESSKVDRKAIAGIGVGSPGTPNRKKGLLVYANNLNFRNTPLREVMQEELDLPVYLDNDANCAALAESIYGAAQDTEYSITITLGTGIGSGIIINRKIYGGFNDAAGELGHMVIVANGELCSCGRKGCWERYASATALIDQTRKILADNPLSLIKRMVNYDPAKIEAKTVFEAAKLADETAQKIIANYLDYLAIGLVNVINIFQPEVLVIGGGISQAGDFLLHPLQAKVGSAVYSRDIPQTILKKAQLGNEAGLIGAAMLVVDF